MLLIIIIIAITSIVTIIAFSNRQLFNRLRFNAYAIKHHKEGWRFGSYALIHANWMHLFINMFVFFSFGDTVTETFEIFFGNKSIIYFILLYLGGVVFSVLIDFGKNKDDPYYSAVGASGAVAAVVFSSILIYPIGSLYLFPIPFPIPSALFGVIYLIYSAYMARRQIGNVGHSAHFWGAIYGIVFTIALKPALVPMFFEQIGSYF